jgi:MFS-type transporter involved in bile tolerance (Atg22 family)
MWAWTLSGSAMIAFLLAPVLGAMADFTASRKKFLFAFASVGSLATLLLSLSGPGDVYWTLALFLVAQLCFVSSLVFYDAFLPLVASDEEADAVSAKGYSYGYIGGGIQFSASLALYASHDALGLSETQAARIAILMAGLWWAVFTIISARLLVEPPISLANHASPARSDESRSARVDRGLKDQGDSAPRTPLSSSGDLSVGLHALQRRHPNRHPNGHSVRQGSRYYHDHADADALDNPDSWRSGLDVFQ